MYCLQFIIDWHLEPFLAQAQLYLFAGPAHALPVIGFAQAQSGADFIGIALQKHLHAEHLGRFGR